MADKKITALTAATEAATEDLLHIIDDPHGSPVNKKLTVKNFLGGISHTTNGTSASTDEVVLKIAHTADIDASSTNVYNNVITFQVNTQPTQATSTGNVGRLYTAEFTNYLNDANVQITTEGAAVLAKLDHRSANGSSVANVYPLIVAVANGDTQTVNTVAFMKFDASGAGSNTVSFVLDILPGGGFGAAAGANAGPVFTTGANTAAASGALKVQVSGQTKYILLHDAIA